MNPEIESGRPWYREVTKYQWLVLLIASLGWIFDVFEGQIFVASMRQAMGALTPAGTPEGKIDFYNNVALGSFLVGGALGGILFGMLSDRIGRTRTMIFTILMYSCFTCVTALSQTWWEMVILRFLVAMGVGGEWAVASAMVAEVFPARARAQAGGIFHASSIFGTYLAVLAGSLIVYNPAFGWRWGFAIGALPAMLTLWIRWKLREPEKWVQAREIAKQDRAKQTGKLSDLFKPDLIRNTLVGVALATVGLATFWGAHIYGKDVLRGWAERELGAGIEKSKRQIEEAVAAVLREHSEAEIQLSSLDLLLEAAEPAAREAVAEVLGADSGSSMDRAELEQLPEKAGQILSEPVGQWEMLGMFLVTTGGGLGLVSFGPICERIGRRSTFLLFHVGGLVSALVLFQYLLDSSPQVLYVALPVFGFLTLGMHAGYAIYFPELFPTRLRGTGAGFCFNGGRIMAAPILIVRGWMRHDCGFSLEKTVSILSLLFLLGIVLSLLGPETKGRELPE
jgi:MFS family permease